MTELRFEESLVNGYILVDHSPAWLASGVNTDIAYEQVLHLLDFFVFENPNQNLTSRSISVFERGWENPWQKPTYLNHKMKDCSNNRYLYYSTATLNNMEDAVSKAELFGSVCLKSEKAVFYDNCKNQSLSCLYHLRNAICHGRFTILEDPKDVYWIACEDVSSSGVKKHAGKKLSARMILKIETLASWKRLITGGPKALETEAAVSKGENNG